MKVSLRASAIFYFPVTKSLVKELMFLSKRHYDGECQRASGRVGQPLYPGSQVNNAKNGVLTIWMDRFAPDATDADTEEVRSTWDELDLISKICEGTYWDPDRAEARKFAARISKTLQIAGPIVLNQWQVEFEVQDGV